MIYEFIDKRDIALESKNLHTERVNRDGTLANYHRSIERVIQVMYERLGDSLTIDDLAESAFMSRYHFIRVFSLITGVSPARFLAAIRIQEAKRLLLKTNYHVTDISLDVGYNSLGTFTRIFSDFVGVPPSRFRELGLSLLGANVGDLASLLGSIEKSRIKLPTITGNVVYDSPLALVTVAMFSTEIPRSRPIECTCLTDSTQFTFSSSLSLNTYIFAVGLTHTTTIEDAILLDNESTLVGAGCPTLETTDNLELKLRKHRTVDLPVVVAYPLLIAESMLTKI